MMKLNERIENTDQFRGLNPAGSSFGRKGGS